MVKNLPAMQETWLLSLGHEDPLEKGLATHSSILAWRIPWTEELGRLQSRGLYTWTQLSSKYTLAQLIDLLNFCFHLKAEVSQILKRSSYFP